MRWLTKREKRWNAYLGEVQGVAVLEVTDPPFSLKKYRDLHVNLAYRAFENCRMVALSQWIDEDQGWDIKDRHAYVATLQDKFSVRAGLTADFDDSRIPEPTNGAYVVHVLGEPNRPLLDEILEFGGTSLSNIAYGVENAPEPWPEKVLSWNKAFVRWFRLVESDEILVRLLEQVGLLFWTADGHLWLALSESRKMDRMLEAIEGLAEEWHLRLVLEPQVSMSERVR